MKVLWFEVTEPSGYRNSGSVIGGWQDSLENIVRNKDEIELYIVFEGKHSDKVVIRNRVTYIPVPTIVSSFIDKFLDSYSWKRSEKRIVDESLKIINKIHPDIIHIYGMEWPWGSIVNHTCIPCVVHIMGSIIPYYNALYPPCYNYKDHLSVYKNKPLRYLLSYFHHLKIQTNVCYEYQRWRNISNYMGRTCWDRSLVNTLHPNANYYHVDEALRPSFLENSCHWSYRNRQIINIVSTGCSNFWKGPDMMLKTANILKNMGVRFLWSVVGSFPEEIRKVVEKKECLSFDDNNIEFVGYKDPDSLCVLLCQSTIYVHTAYIENSPNSICEAQILGVPIVSTNVGGISTLVGENGILVPANDPWRMADAIVELSNNKEKMIAFSNKGKEIALQRHNPEKIYSDLICCYTDIIHNSQKDIN